ncbi:MAG: ribulokinase [Microthrixaceae bacterium]
MVGGNDVVVGVDFGTLSARAVVLRVADGEQLGTGVDEYRHGVIDEVLPAGGVPLPPDWALQDPADYLVSIDAAVRAAVADAGVDPAQVVGIATDFTACTVLPTLRDGRPLSELARFRERPHAYAKLWKHHAAQDQADRLNAVAHERREPWIERYGGRLSSEWELAKGLQLLEEDPEIYAATECWVEASDWIVWQLSGAYFRNVCATGYKAARQDGAYPSPEFFAAVSPGFERFALDKVGAPIGRLGDVAGGLRDDVADRLGLPAGIPVAVGNVDAHVCAAAAGAVGPGQLLAIMGTSTCHVMNGSDLRAVPGMCGVVEDGIVPGLWGYEAGQSGVGDVFGWFVDRGVPAEVVDEARRSGRSVHEHLSQLAFSQPVGAHGLVALDWLSGNRSVLVDHTLSGLVVGLTLHTRPEEIYRALVEATAYGTRLIVDSFEAGGVPVQEFIAGGGLLRNPHVMQTYADVLGRPVHAIDFEHAPAAGAAIHAAVAAGAYPDITAAAAAMARVRHDAWRPDRRAHAAYEPLYDIYVELHDRFGRDPRIMHELHRIRTGALAG